MGHSIIGIILAGDYNKQEAEEYELKGINLDINLNLFFINGFYTAVWQKKLKTSGYLEVNCPHITWYPSDIVIAELMRRISKNEVVKYAIILTDYFGGVGEQFANVYVNAENVDLEINTINKALSYLGVISSNDHDEFDAVGLGKYRSNPDYLDKYRDLANELGL